MKNYLSDAGPALLSNGYLIVPIVPGEKRPAINGWQHSRMTAMDLGNYPGHGVGILCGQGARPVVGIDIDISHPVIGSSIIDWCRKHLGWSPERVGAAPRVMLVYRAAEAGWAKGNSMSFFDPLDPTKPSGKRNEQQIEILGLGQQFVAYHTHPDTGMPYEWTDMLGGLEFVPNTELPEITEIQIEKLFVELARLIAATPGLETESTHTNVEAGDDDWLLFQTPKQGLTLAEARDAAFGIDNTAGVTYDDYLKVAMALHHEFDGSVDALEVFLEWARQSAKFKAGDAEPRWRSFGKSARSVTMLWVLRQAKGLPESLEALIYAGRVDRTDAGNANLLYQLTSGNLRYVTERACFMHWDGSAWGMDVSRTVAQHEALGVANVYLKKAERERKQAENTSLPDSDRKRLLRVAESTAGWANQCRNRRTIENMLALAARDSRFAISAGLLDRDPLVLGVQNGVVDLRTGELRTAARDDLVTKRSKYAFLKSAPAPRWQSFVRDITGYPVKGAGVGDFTHRGDLACYLQKAIGYSITGLTAQHKMFIAVGAGGNGKNVLLDTVQEVAGDYWRSIQPEALMTTRHDADAERPSPTTASLAGARAAISSESRDGQRLDVALLKRHTGGGFMTGRLMRENTLTFEITHKLWLMTNHLPSLDHLDDAMRGRLHLIPFDRQWNRPGHTDRNPALPDGDKDLMATLRSEGEGILKWVIDGAGRCPDRSCRFESVVMNIMLPS